MRVSNLRNVLRLQDFEMILEVVETKALRLHEETIPELLERLVRDLEKGDVIHHPIIADKDTLVVLDGTHRVEAFNTLGLRYIPACLVDYMDPRIKVGCWYRTAEKGNAQISLTDLFEAFKEFDSAVRPVSDAVKSSNAIAIVYKDKACISKPYHDLREVYQAIKHFESRLKSSGFAVGYTTEEEARKKLQNDAILAYLAMPALTKTMIVKTALSGERFPSKTSRHVIPARPMGIDFPMNNLRSGSLEEVNRRFYNWVSKKKVQQLPPGQELEGRRYEESLLLLE
jgi:hypothetical protein